MTEYIVSLEPSEYEETLVHKHYPVRMRKGGTWEWSTASCTYCTDELTEIVRCRDCRRWATEMRFTAKCIGPDGILDPNGFCSRGEEGGER